MRTRPKIISDVVHGNVILSPLMQAIIDTPEFQRLRTIHQLGVVKYVFPSANHSRFEHSIGTTFLVRKYIRYLRASAFISERLEELIALAGLCHDMGHTMFSHMFDHTIAREIGAPHHEKRSVDLFRHMVDKYRLALSPEEVDLICAIILGERLKDYPPWIFQIVANADFDFDVDKCDYLLRDSYACGLKCSLEIERIFMHAEIHKGSIRFHKKAARNLLQVFMTRFSLFETVYRHPVVINVEIIMQNILVELARVMNWKCMFEGNEWTHLTDALIPALPLMFPHNKVLMSNYHRLQTRQLLKQITESEANAHDGPVKQVEVIVGVTSKWNHDPFSRIVFFDDDCEEGHPIDVQKLSLAPLYQLHRYFYVVN